MERVVIPFTTEEAWKAERVKDITSSDVSVLFGVGYQTYQQLFEAKLHGKEMQIEENERMQWGKALQEGIANEFARKNKWKIRPKTEYVRLKGLRIGSSFDYEIESENEDDKGESHSVREILEIKNVSFESYKGWIRGFQTEMSPYIEIQVQHQMLVSGIDVCYVGALIAGCQGIVLKREANPKVQSAILNKVEQFWRSIDEVHDN